MTFAKAGSPFLHRCEFDAKIERTHLGQAHLAGTGPKGTTCRECAFFASDGHYAKSDKKRAGVLKDGRCLAPQPGKAKRRFPHTAESCLLFEANPNPPLAQKKLA